MGIVENGTAEEIADELDLSPEELAARKEQALLARGASPEEAAAAADQVASTDKDAVPPDTTALENPK